jgi:hypothetical protein
MTNEQNTQKPDPKPKGKGPRIFISYAHRDKDYADELSKWLRRVGCKPCKDDETIKAGEPFDKQIRDAISHCEAVVVLISAAEPSKLLAREWSAICEESWENPGLKVIPLLLEDCKAPVFLQDKFGLECRGDTSKPREFAKVIADAAEATSGEHSTPGVKIFWRKVKDPAAESVARARFEKLGEMIAALQEEERKSADDT